MAYDAAGLLRSIVDGRHPKETATDDNGRTTALKSGPFHLATISYDDAGRPTSESNPELGTTTTYQYNDPLGRLTNKIITMPTAGGNSVQTETHSYQGVQDTITRTTTTTTANHTATRTENIELTRDAAGRITRTKETTAGGDHIITVTYNAYGQVLTSNDQATGLTTTNSYDVLGNLTGSEASRMRVSQTVDVDGTLRKRTTTGPHTALTVTEDFDVWGRPTKTTTTAFGGSTTTISYSEGTRTITPPVGAVITETFNGRGLVSKRDRGEVKSAIRYDGTRMEKVSSTQPNLNSSMESIVDAVGRTESTYEDTGHAIYSTTTSWNNRTGIETASWRSAQATIVIDGYGRDVQQTLIGVVSQNIVDVDGGTVLRKSPNLHPQKYSYSNNQVTSIDWGGRTTTMDYDAAGRMIEQVDPLFHRITNEYDELNIIRSSVISAEVEETHAFDTGGYLSNRDTANGTHSYSHGAGGELLSLVTPTGAYGYTYEKDGLLNSLQPPGGARQRFTYDSNRRLASRSRGTSKWITTHSGAQATTQSQLGLTTTIITDARGRPVSETFGGAGGLQQRSTTYTVDDQPLTISDDVITTFTYDALLRITGKTRSGTSPRSYDYNDSSTSLSVAQANGAYAYNGFGELTQAGPVSLQYSNEGLLTGKTGETRSYTSTSLLSGITTNTTDISYSYDGNGNRLTETINGVTKSYTYDSSDRLLSMTSPTTTESYQLRGDGARTSATINGVTTTYSYDSADGLQGNGYTTDADGRVTLRNSVPLVWDAANRLLSIGTSTNSYDGQNQRLSAPGHDWTWGMGMEAVDGDVIISGMNTVLAKGTEVYGHDAIGSIMGNDYGPFGDSATVGIGYTGHWNDDTGLVYAQQRWLDPMTGRFLSEDPVAGDVMQPMSTQGFIYANGNPTRYVDPDGRIANLALGGIGAALGAVGGCGVSAYYAPSGSKWSSCGIGLAAGATAGFVGGVTFGASIVGMGATVATATTAQLAGATVAAGAAGGIAGGAVGGGSGAAIDGGSAEEVIAGALVGGGKGYFYGAGGGAVAAGAGAGVLAAGGGLFAAGVVGSLAGDVELTRLGGHIVYAANFSCALDS